MSIWRIPVTWEMCGCVAVEGDTLAQAIETARQEDAPISLPPDANYVDGSWGLSTEDEGIFRLYQKMLPSAGAHNE